MDERAFNTNGMYLGPHPAGDAPSFLVFGQAPAFDEHAWDKQSLRFFKSRLGFVHPKAPEAVARPVGASERLTGACDGAVVVVACDAMAPGKRWVYSRGKTAGDDALVERAESLGGLPGMSQLARRCNVVLTISAESALDPLALTLAAVLASLYLGPIIPPERAEAFGVQSARIRLEKATILYR
jgi:hypothetical protein